MENKNWLKEDEVCSHCGQVTKKQKGLTKQNVKRLFSIKLDMNELVMTIIIILVIFSAFSYKTEIQICRDYIAEAKETFVPDCANTLGGCFHDFNFTTINDTGE